MTATQRDRPCELLHAHIIFRLIGMCRSNTCSSRLPASTLHRAPLSSHGANVLTHRWKMLRNHYAVSNGAGRWLWLSQQAPPKHALLPSPSMLGRRPPCRLRRSHSLDVPRQVRAAAAGVPGCQQMRSLTLSFGPSDCAGFGTNATLWSLGMAAWIHLAALLHEGTPVRSGRSGIGPMGPAFCFSVAVGQGFAIGGRFGLWGNGSPVGHQRCGGGCSCSQKDHGFDRGLVEMIELQTPSCLVRLSSLTSQVCISDLNSGIKRHL